VVVAAVASHVTAVQALKLPSDLTTYHNALSFSTGCCLIGMIARLVSLIPCLSWHTFGLPLLRLRAVGRVHC